MREYDRITLARISVVPLVYFIFRNASLLPKPVCIPCLRLLGVMVCRNAVAGSILLSRHRDERVLTEMLGLRLLLVLVFVINRSVISSVKPGLLWVQWS